MHVHSFVTRAIDESLRAEVGIPGAWYEALIEIAFAGGTMRMHEFAEETTLTKSGATRFIDRLEHAGLVERVECPTDRRAYNLALTDRGKAIQEKADPHVLRVIEDRFGSHMSDEEARVLLDTLNRMRKSPAPA